MSLPPVHEPPDPTPAGDKRNQQDAVQEGTAEPPKKKVCARINQAQKLACFEFFAEQNYIFLVDPISWSSCFLCRHDVHGRRESLQ